MPPMMSRRAGARERRTDGEAVHPSSLLIRASRVGMGSAEEGAGGGLGGGWVKVVFLAFEDDAVEKSAAGGGAERGGQDIRFCFVDLGEGKLEGVGAAGSVPAGALVFERGDGADPGIGEARAARVRVGDAIVVDFEHERAGG